MEKCTLCPKTCNVDRINNLGFCKEGLKARVSWAGLHRGEEPPLIGEKGSGTVFFSSCTLSCPFCQNYQISRPGNNIGKIVSDEELANIFLELEKMGAANINLITGTHFTYAIINALKIAKNNGLTLPIVWNSSGYETVETLELLDPFIDLYLLDAKTISETVSTQFCGGKDYPKVIKKVLRFLKEKYKKTDLENQKGVLIRHLVFPGTLDASIQFINYFGQRYKDNFALSLMVQFVPPLQDVDFPKIRDEEYDLLIDALEDAEIEEGFVQEMGDEIVWIPNFNKTNPFADGFADALDYFINL